MPVRVVLAIDVEPDPRIVHVAHPDHWRGLFASLQLVRDLRERLSSLQHLPVAVTWRRHCVEAAAAAYRAHFHLDCQAHSFGDRFLSEDAVDLVESEGMILEMTAEPGLREQPWIRPDEATRGGLPDHRTAPPRAASGARRAATGV